MQDRKMTNRISPAGSMLHLPIQSMPINRNITGSTLGRDSGVQPQQFGEGVLAGILIGVAVHAINGMIDQALHAPASPSATLYYA